LRVDTSDEPASVLLSTGRPSQDASRVPGRGMTFSTRLRSRSPTSSSPSLIAHLLERRRADERAFFRPPGLSRASPRSRAPASRRIAALRRFAPLGRPLAGLGGNLPSATARRSVGRTAGPSIAMAIVLDDSIEHACLRARGTRGTVPRRRPRARLRCPRGRRHRNRLAGPAPRNQRARRRRISARRAARSRVSSRPSPQPIGTARKSSLARSRVHGLPHSVTASAFSRTRPTAVPTLAARPNADEPLWIPRSGPGRSGRPNCTSFAPTENQLDHAAVHGLARLPVERASQGVRSRRRQTRGKPGFPPSPGSPSIDLHDAAAISGSLTGRTRSPPTTYSGAISGDLSVALVAGPGDSKLSTALRLRRAGIGALELDMRVRPLACPDRVDSHALPGISIEDPPVLHSLRRSARSACSIRVRGPSRARPHAAARSARGASSRSFGAIGGVDVPHRVSTALRLDLRVRPAGFFDLPTARRATVVGDFSRLVRPSCSGSGAPCSSDKKPGGRGLVFRDEAATSGDARDLPLRPLFDLAQKFATRLGRAPALIERRGRSGASKERIARGDRSDQTHLGCRTTQPAAGRSSSRRGRLPSGLSTRKCTLRRPLPSASTDFAAAANHTGTQPRRWRLRARSNVRRTWRWRSSRCSSPSRAPRALRQPQRARRGL